MTNLRYAVLTAALLALAGCKDGANEAINLWQGKPVDADPLAPAEPVITPAADPQPEPPRYVVLDGTGPMGEVLATGPDCHPQFRMVICQ